MKKVKHFPHRSHIARAPHSSSRFIVAFHLLPLFICLLTPATQILSQSTRGSSHEQRIIGEKDYAYRPMPQSGYMQSWNISFQGGGYTIHATYVISNIGPGDLNNGVVLMIQGPNDLRRKGLAEYDIRYLKARPGKFNIRMGDNNFLLKTGSLITTGIKVGSSRAIIRIHASRRGIALTRRPEKIEGSKKYFVDAIIPVTSARAEAILWIDGKKIKLRGLAGIDYFITNRSPLNFAKRFLIFRTMGPNHQLFIGDIRASSTDSLKNPFTLQYIVNGFAFSRKNKRRQDPSRPGDIYARLLLSKKEEVKNKEVHGAKLPQRIYYHTRSESGNECRIRLRLRRPPFSIDLLQYGSSIISVFIKFFFAQPHILRGEADYLIRCQSVDRRRQWTRSGKGLISSYYIK